jgi:outer membrane protein TolC
MQLNLFGKASLNSQESELGQAFSTIGSKNIYTLGIEGSFPLEGRRENGLKNAQLESVNAAKASYDASLLQLSTWLDQKYLELNTLSFQIKANEENIKLSEKIALFEEKKFSQGRSPSQQFVLQAHNQVLSAKLQQLTLIHLRKITTLQIYAVLDLFQPKISEIIK